MERRDHAPPQILPQGVQPIPSEGAPEPLYFAVSTTKLVVMSLCTLGIYGTYWFYKNWTLIKAREQSRISPVWRSLLEFLFCYSCLARIRESAKEHRLAVSLPAGPLTAGFILVGLLGFAPSPCWQLSSLAVFFLVPVQVTVNRINARLAPGHDENRSFSASNIGIMSAGVVLTLASMLGVLPVG